MNVASVSNAGMQKVQGVLGKASIIETVIWVVLGIVVVVLAVTLHESASTEQNVLIVAALTIVLGIASGITLYFAVKQDTNTLFQLWFVETVLLLVCLVVGIVLVSLNLKDVEGYIELAVFIVIIPIKIYCFLLVWKYYKWNNRAKGLGKVAAAVGLA